MTRGVRRIAERAGLFYRGVRAVARFWVWFFFKRVDVRHAERLPVTGPVLLCVNHPNNLIDSLLVGVAVTRPVHFLATATLFRNPVLARFLRAAGALPVYRRADDPGRMDRNVDAFAAVFRAFENAAVVAIYPEGTTHAEARVQRIKTGAARLALGWEVEHPGTLPVIPVGLSFEARKSFHGRVLVSFGPPVPVRAYAAHYGRDAVHAVDELTDAIQRAMEAEVVHVDRIEATALVRAVEELYRDTLVRQLHSSLGLSERRIDPFRLSRTIVDAVNHFKTSDPERVERIWHRIQAYRALLARFRVRDETVRARDERGGARSWRAVVGAVPFAYGALVNAVPYLGPRWLARRLARKETDYATIRLLASIAAFPLAWGAETWAVAYLAGAGWATAFALSLPVSGLIAYRYVRGVGRLRRAWRFARLALADEDTARRLIAERRAIVAELERARDEYLTATRGSSF